MWARCCCRGAHTRAADAVRRLPPQIDMNVLPLECSYNACGRCYRFGDFPCAWYKIIFIFVGLAGQYATRGLYSDSEVTYARRIKFDCPCCGGRLKPVDGDAGDGAAKAAQ